MPRHNAALLARLDVAEERIEAQARELKTQEQEARTDSLTSLANRGAFDAFSKRTAAGFKPLTRRSHC